MKLWGFSPPGHGLTSSGPGPSPPRRPLPAKHRGAGRQRSAAAAGHSQPRGQSREKGPEEEGATGRDDTGAGGHPPETPAGCRPTGGRWGLPTLAKSSVAAAGRASREGTRVASTQGWSRGSSHGGGSQACSHSAPCQGGLGCVRVSGTSRGINSGSSYPFSHECRWD